MERLTLALWCLLLSLATLGCAGQDDDDDQAAPDDDGAADDDDNDDNDAATDDDDDSDDDESDDDDNDDNDDDDNDDDDNDDNDDDDDDDDTAIDDCSSPYVLGEITYQRVIGGDPGALGTAVAFADGELLLAATKGEAIVLYHKLGGAPWTAECFTRFGESPQLAVDGLGVLHALYDDTLAGTIVHATRNGQTWDREVVRAAPPWLRALRVSADGAAYVALGDSDAMTLSFATNRSGAWQEHLIESFPDETYLPDFDLAVDADGRAHVVYARRWSLVVGAETDGVFEWTEAFGHPSAPSLTVRPDGGVDLAVNTAYFGGIYWEYIFYVWIPFVNWVPSMTFGELNGSDFAVEFTDEYGDPHSGPLQATDGDQRRHLIYERTGYPTVLRYASDRGGEWAAADVSLGDQHSFQRSLALDENGDPHVSYEDSFGTGLFHAEQTDGQWRRENLDADPFDLCWPTLAARPDGNGRVFLAECWGPLAVVDQQGAAWTLTTLPEMGEIGGAIAAFIGADGVTRLGLDSYDGDLARLLYADDAGGAFAYTAVDVANGGIADPALAADAQGAVHLLYRKSGDGFGVMYADNAGGSWKTRTIEAMRNWDGPGAIATEPAGRVHVLYVRQYDDDTLRYGVVDGDEVTLETVAEPIDRDGSLGLAVDADGAPHICYCADDGVVYAKREGAWAVEQIGPGHSPGLSADCLLRLDDADAAHIIYANEGLFYVTNVSGAWTTAQVADYGDLPAMALDNQGQVRVSYYRLGVMHASFPQGLGAK